MKFTLAVPYDWRDVRLSFQVAAYASHDGVRLHVKVNPECIDYSDKYEMADAVVYRTAHGTRVRNLQQFNSMFLDIYEEFKIRNKHVNPDSENYGSGAMPYSTMFYPDMYVHYSSGFASQGYSGSSHGCVNIRSLADAKWIFHNTPIGATVFVYGGL